MTIVSSLRLASLPLLGFSAVALAALAPHSDAQASETNEEFCSRIVGNDVTGLANCIKNLGGPTVSAIAAKPSVYVSPPELPKGKSASSYPVGSNERYCAGFTTPDSAPWRNCVLNLNKAKAQEAPPAFVQAPKYAERQQPQAQAAAPKVINYSALTKNQLCRQMKAARKAKTASYSEYLLELSRRGLTEKNCAVQWGKILAGIAIVGVVAAAAADGGGGGYSGSGYNSYSPQDYSYSWDDQNDFYTGRRWVCRGEQTGKYADLYKCNGKLKVDSRWPG